MNQQIEYLVRWEEYPDPEWIPEDHFDELKLINEFNNKIHRKEIVETNSPIEPIKPRGRGRPKKIISLLPIFMSFIFLLCVSADKTEYNNTVNDNFKFCDKSTQNIVYLKITIVQSKTKVK